MNSEIKIENGVQQGDALSAILVDMVMEGIIRPTEINKTID